MSAVAIVVGFFAVILFVLWIALPFSVFGIKPLLRQVLDRLDRLNDRLESLERTVSESKKEENEAEMEPGPRQMISSGHK
jgi:predicted PurR-regulated permease PerM